MSETALSIWINECTENSKFREYNSSTNLSDYTEKGDSAVVVAVGAVTLVLIQSNYFCVLHVLWYASFFPALAHDCMKRSDESFLPYLITSGGMSS